MDFVWFTYTVALMVVTTIACAVNATVSILAGRRDSMAAAVAFFLYTLDTGTILFDEYLQTKPLGPDYFDVGLTHPVFQVVVGCLLVSSAWAWCLLRSGFGLPRPAFPAGVAGYLLVSTLLAPVGGASSPWRMMAYWGLRDLAVIAALVWAGAGAGAPTAPRRGPSERRWLVAALSLSVLVLVEDAFNILVIRPDLSSGWMREFLWHLTERNLSENALVLLCAVASVLSARQAVLVFSRHPTRSRERLEDEPLQSDFETRLLAFSDGHGLSGREREVLELTLKDADNQGIASALVISTGTVKAHLSRIYKKVGVASRSELVEAFWQG